MVRVPDAVPPGETRGRVRFVYRRPGLNPGIAPGARTGILGQFASEVLVKQAGMPRATAVMNQACNRPQTDRLKRRQILVRPGPGAVALILLPQQAASQSTNAKLGEEPQIAQSLSVSRQVKLVKIPVTHAVTGIFRASPDLRHRSGHPRFRHRGRRHALGNPVFASGGETLSAVRRNRNKTLVGRHASRGASLH